MNFLNWTHLGGMPFTQDRMKFLQDSNLGAFSAIAKLCGDKTILTGIEVVAGNVSAGWFSYNGELLEFVGGPANVKVKITETTQSLTYANASINSAQLTRTATCALLGDFDFSELIRLETLQNVWMPGDIKEKFVNPAYLAANFDGNGFGLNRERGWRLMSFAYPASKGKFFINYNPDDFQFETAGLNGGSKTIIIGVPNLPPIPVNTPKLQNDMDRGGFASNWSLDDVQTNNVGGTAQPINVVNPFFVTIKTIKL